MKLLPILLKFLKRKSDQGGIESPSVSLLEQAAVLRKSDQGGIESFTQTKINEQEVF